MVSPTPPSEPTDEGASGDASADIRLLGRLIGDVLREQTSDATFQLVETVRQTAVTACLLYTSPSPRDA